MNVLIYLAIFSIILGNIQAQNPRSGPHTEYNLVGTKIEGLQTLVTYQIENEKLVKPVKSEVSEEKLLELQNNIADQQKIWDFVKKTLPKDILNEFVLVVFEHVPDVRDSFIIVHPFDRLDKWTLEIVLPNAIKKGSINAQKGIEELIRLSGKLIFEKSDQVKLNEELYIKGEDLPLDEAEALSDAAAEECGENYFTGLACALPDSYIAQFYKKFWEEKQESYDKIIDEFGENNQDMEEVKALGEAYKEIFKAEKNSFVSLAAVQSPDYDLQETWFVFVMRNPPKGNTIKDQKIKFLYEFPELVKYREQFRQILILE